MNNIFIRFFFVLLLLVSTLFVKGQEKLTLEEAIETGIKNNLEVNQSGLNRKRENIALKQSRAYMLPDLNINATHGMNQGRSIDPFTNSFINQKVNFASYGANSSILLFHGLSLQNEIKENQLAYKAAGMEWQQAKDNITINIILAYLNILSAEDVLEQSRLNATVSNKQVHRLEILYEEGAIAPPEYYDLKGQVAAEQLAIANFEAALARAKLDLCQLMNIPYDDSLEVARLPLDTFAISEISSPESVYASSLQNFAEVEAVHLRTLSAEKGLQSTKGELFPTLSLGGSINTNYSSVATQSYFVNTTEVPSNNYVVINGDKAPVIVQQNNFDTRELSYGDQLNNNLFSSIYLALSIPIFNASQTRNQIKLAKIDLKNRKLIEKNTKTELQQAIERAYVNVTTARQKYRILQEQVAAFSESFRAAEVRFNAGAMNSVDYLIAKNNLNQAQTNLIIAKYDFVLRKKVLEYYSGE